MEAKLLQRLAVILLALCFASCQSTPSARAFAPIEAGSEYVALGSSFAAGPGVGERDVTSLANCGRSKLNYAHLLAQRMALELVDVSCGGATTQDILNRHQHPTTPPQIEAITANTRLVTITIGGNDLGLARDLAQRICPYEQLPEGAFCAPIRLAPMQEDYIKLEKNLAMIARGARIRAPHARIVFLDYQAILPETGSCDNVIIDEREVTGLRQRQMKLGEILRKVSRENGVEFFSAYEATQGHDACSERPFMAGAKSIGTGAWAVPNFHTTQEGMGAIAQGLENYLMQR